MPVDRPEEDDLDEGVRSRIDPTRIRDTQIVDAVSTRVATPPVPRPDPALLHVPGLADVLTQEGTLAGTRERWMPYRGLCECPYRYRGPRFTLSGTVYFRPLQPFDPHPHLPADSSSEMVAFAQIGNAKNRSRGSLGEPTFRYPEDILHDDIDIH